jgi:uncharacterized membrane protein (DUF373 family)
MQMNERKIAPIKQFIATALGIGYDFVIVSIACGILGAGLILLYDIITDFWYLGTPNHTFAHLINDLMLALIIMALLDQVNKVIRGTQFTLLPFISVGLIVSIRGFLVAQIRVSLGEIEWADGLIQLGSYAVMTIAMATCFYVFSREAKGNG